MAGVQSFAMNQHQVLKSPRKSDSRVLSSRSMKPTNKNCGTRRTDPKLERRVLYVGDLPPGFNKDALHRRFNVFGEIEQIKLKSKECSSFNKNRQPVWEKKFYAFITYKFHDNVRMAIQDGNKCPGPLLKLDYGGRREYVKEDYSDLGGKAAESDPPGMKKEDDYSLMLAQEQRRRGLIAQQ